MLPTEKLESLRARFSELEDQLCQPEVVNDSTRYVKLSRERGELQPLVEAYGRYLHIEKQIREDREALEDPELRDMALEELPGLEKDLERINAEISVLLLPTDRNDERDTVLEIRSGTGGEEASLFAADLFRMYSRYADHHGWKTEVISTSENDLGGYKEIVASISGRGVFARLKFESGVHRVQRIPATEAGGRIHTSAATVAVLPEAEEIDLEIRPEDLRIDTMRAGGAGGQHVNKTESAVRITHLPSGIAVVSAEKSQHQNRRLAMQVLRSRLYEMERREAADERAAARKDQVGSGDRSQRSRTYNFPQGRVTDHRINLTLHKLDDVLEGGALEEIIDALITQHQASQLAELSGRDSA